MLPLLLKQKNTISNFAETNTHIPLKIHWFLPHHVQCTVYTPFWWQHIDCLMTQINILFRENLSIYTCKTNKSVINHWRTSASIAQIAITSAWNLSACIKNHRHAIYGARNYLWCLFFLTFFFSPPLIAFKWSQSIWLFASMIATTNNP